MKCAKCVNPLLLEAVFSHSYHVCFHCHLICWQISTLKQIVTSSYADALDGLLDRHWPKDQHTCPACASTIERVPLSSIQRPERESNLRLFPDYRPWFDFHRKGVVELLHCRSCASVWHNARTACTLPVDWNQREGEFQLERAAQLSTQSIAPSSDLNENIATYIFGLPYIENIPTFSDIPYTSLLVAGIVTIATFHGFSDPEFASSLVYRTDAAAPHVYVTMLTYALIHAGTRHWFGNMLSFMFFAPMVERELKGAQFVTLLAAAAVAGALLQSRLAGGSLVGFSGSVTGVIAFFCMRFPKAIIAIALRGFLLRLSAPTALFFYVLFNIFLGLQNSAGRGGVAGWCHLGGMAAGIFLSLVLPKGASSQAFIAMEKEKQRQLMAPKNWRDAG